ncbi:phospholipase [Gracilibacillus sp. YIM 98692]|uniref:phospholipase n=1 Tax=Gracilibacillus sp. YIM 98692 TaxID=2663532 RepID=UPI0013D3D539|nr:phospholipase [Gracilibacillus sp. YIM 98692]
MRTSHRRRRRPRLCIFSGYNWCGPGCSGPGEPINAVDAACKAHDKCYQRNVDRSGCDEAFIKRLEAFQNPYSREGRHARLMLQYMKIQHYFRSLP